MWQKYRSISILLIIIFVACFARVSTASTYFVSPTGDNTNPGSREAPFKSLAFAAGKVISGDTVIAMDGIYFENDSHKGDVGLYVRKGGVSAENKIVFKAMNQGGAIIDGRSKVLIGLYIGPSSNYVQIEGFQIRNFKNHGIMVYGKYAVIKQNIIVNNGNLADPGSPLGYDGVYTSTNAKGCMIDGNLINGNGRITLHKTDANGNKDHGIYLCSRSSTVQNNLILRNQAYGVHIAGYVNLDNVLITNNTIADQKNYGGIIVWLKGARNIIIQNNVIINNNSFGLDFSDDGGGHIVWNNDFFNNFLGPINPFKSSQYLAANNLTADPLLDSNFRPQLSSPLLKSGYAEQAPDHDMVGTARPSFSGVTIGCFQ